MKEIRELMGMRTTVDIVDAAATQKDLNEVFEYFVYIDNTFSTYKPDSELSRFNNGHIRKQDLSEDMKTVMQLCEDTNEETHGYFNALKSGIYDPSGLVKGWAMMNCADLIRKKDFEQYYVEAGTDAQVNSKDHHKKWEVGIRNPFNIDEILKVVYVRNQGVATSGTYIRGNHLYNPHLSGEKITDIVSLTVIGPNIYEADRFSTAAFAMGRMGIQFIENLPQMEGYMIDKNGIAVYTTGFMQFTKPK